MHDHILYCNEVSIGILVLFFFFTCSVALNKPDVY